MEQNKPIEEVNDIVNDIDKQLKNRKRWIYILASSTIVLSVILIIQSIVIQDMAYDLRNEISINHDLEQIASFCMQSNFTNTGDSQ